MSEALNELTKSFVAFNQNAMNSIIYIMQQNIWFVLIAVAAIAAMIMMLKEEVDYSVNEVQKVI